MRETRPLAEGNDRISTPSTISSRASQTICVTLYPSVASNLHAFWKIRMSSAG